MTLNQPLSRPVLSVISNNQLNIHNNIPNTNNLNESNTFIKNNAHSTPIRSKSNNLNVIANKKRLISEINNSNEDDEDISPKLKRARLLKMKLQLAYFKVKTNQTDIPLSDLKLPNNKNNNKSIFNKNTKNHKTINKKKISNTLKSLKKSTMDDIVTKKGTFANLKRFNQEFTSSNKNSSIPSSAPPNILSFNQNLHYSNIGNNVSSVTSPSKFAITLIDKKRVRLPPVPKLLGLPHSNIFQIPNNNNHTNNTNMSFNDTTIDDRNDQTQTQIQISSQTQHNNHNTNDSTILQNESTSTPLLHRRHSIDQIERNDPDLTILQSNSILMSTPVRHKKDQNNKKSSSHKSNQPKKPISSNSASNNNIDFATPSSSKRKSDSKNKLKQNNSILKDDDETQLMSSPTRLLSTPSSIGAAKCLLQLAHR